MPLVILIAAGGHGSSSQPDPSDFQVVSISEIGSGTDGRRHVELRGTFNGAGDARAEAICNGSPVPAAIAAAESTRMDVSIPEPRSGTSCTFRLHRLTDGVSTAPSPNATLLLQDPANEITGSRDIGVANGRHVVELYGAFTTPAQLNATYGVTCNLRSAAGVQQQWTGDHFNISFDDTGEPRCTFVFGYGDGRRTNLWGPIDLRAHSPLTGFGAYIWSTETRPRPGEDDALESAALPLFRAGFDVVRLHMAPSWREPGISSNHYKFNLDLFNGECPPGAPFLPCAARIKAFQRLASSPGARVVMLTVADSSSAGVVFRADSWLNASPVRAAVVKEYRDLALALYETQANTGKTFIVSTYESDNDLYCGCGSGNDFVNNTNGCRTTCEDRPDCGTKCQGPGDLPHWRVMESLRNWFQARHDGIEAARQIASARGIRNVVVADAIEVSTIRRLQDMTSCKKKVGTSVEALPHCPNMLDDVVPVVKPTYVSWSAWEGIRDDLPGQPSSSSSIPGRTPRLDADLAYLKARLAALPGSPQLIVGEFGIEFHPDFSQHAYGWANGEIAKAIQRARLPVNVAWEAYDSIETPTFKPYGLFYTSGNEKPGMIQLRTALREGVAEMAALPNPPGRIAGIVVSAVRLGQQVYDLFEVYGTFPSPPQNASDISLICNGDGVTAPNLEWLAAHPGQVNFRIAHDNSSTLRYCSVKFPGTWTHGPKKLWPGTCAEPVCR
jgi:hypothetical protein